MLFDRRWERREPSLAGFIAWLERQPARGSYNWRSYNACACAQYYASLGRHNCNEWMHGPLDAIAYGQSGQRGQWTFGACLARAKAHAIA